MEIGKEKKEELAQKTRIIFEKLDQVSEEMQEDLAEYGNDLTSEEKEKIAKVVLKVIRKCRTPNEVVALFKGRSKQGELMWELDVLGVMKSEKPFKIAEKLSKKYAGEIPNLMTERAYSTVADVFAQAIAEKEDAEDKVIFEEFIKRVSYTHVGVGMIPMGYEYLLPREILLPPALKDIIFHNTRVFDGKYPDFTHDQRLKLCERAEGVVDQNSSREEAMFFLDEGLIEQQKVLPVFEELSTSEKNFLKDAVNYYFDYQEKHPGFIETVKRKVCSWVGKGNEEPANAVSKKRGDQTRS